MPRWSDAPVTFDHADTLHSARGKLEGAAGGWPVVILEPGCKIADNVLTYRLLARTSERLGSPLAVVTRSPYWRKLAREHGLRAFSSTGSLGRASRRSASSFLDTVLDTVLAAVTPSFSRQGWVILGIVALLAGFASYSFMPVMKVTILTPVQEISQDITVRVDASISSLDVSAGLIPGRVIEYRFTASDTVGTTADKNVGKERAKGEVTVINTTPSLVTIPAGTVLSAGDGQKFTTSTAVAIGSYQQPRPASTAGPGPSATAGPTAGAAPTAGPGGVAGTTMRVPVVAVEPGTKGNVAALAIAKFESESFGGLTVFNEQPLSGGTDAKAKVASGDDRSRLREALFQQAQRQALAELQMRIRQSESLIPHSMQVRVEREDYDKNVDEEADKLKGTLSVVATAIGFDNTDLNTLVEKQWRAAVPKGFRGLPGALQINPPEVLQAGSQTASLKVRTAGKAERVLEADDLSQSLRGLSLQDAKTRLSQLENPLRLVRLEMWPDWAGRAFRVEVQTVQ